MGCHHQSMLKVCAKRKDPSHDNLGYYLRAFNPAKRLFASYIAKIRPNMMTHECKSNVSIGWLNVKNCNWADLGQTLRYVSDYATTLEML